ncbi:hypothetical protein DFAR_1920002 [Desulfarculales bacterium]
MTNYLIGLLIKILLLAPPILMALTVHEASHALVAWLGRLHGQGCRAVEPKSPEASGRGRHLGILCHRLGGLGHRLA